MLLSLNTCGSLGSVALGRIDPSGAVEIVAQAELAARTYSAQLIPKIGEMLAAQQVAVRDLQAIVVVRGPGSFTGIRVGLSAAKGLTEASGAGLIALSQLALLAGGSGLAHVMAAIDAGRGEYYAGEYREGKMTREMVLSAAELRAAAEEVTAGALVCEAPAGDHGLSAANGGSGAVLGEAIYLKLPDAADALRFAATRFCAGLFDDIESLDANYLRRSDAEIFGSPGGSQGDPQGGLPGGTPREAQKSTQGTGAASKP